MIDNTKHPLTRYEVIGWSIAGPLIVLLVVVTPNIYGMMGHFRTMFTSIGGKLPASTRFFLTLGEPWTYLILVTIVALPIVVLLTVRVPRYQIIVPVLCALGASYLRILISAVLRPILELQKTLS